MSDEAGEIGRVCWGSGFDKVLLTDVATSPPEENMTRKTIFWPRSQNSRPNNSVLSQNSQSAHTGNLAAMNFYFDPFIIFIFSGKMYCWLQLSGFWAVPSIDSIEEDIIRARNVPRDKKRRKRKSERATVANIWQQNCVKKRVKTIILFDNSC